MSAAVTDSPSPCSPITPSSATVQFTQREINISPKPTDDGDFGGVWLGDETGEGTTEAIESDAVEYGGKDGC